MRSLIWLNIQLFIVGYVSGWKHIYLETKEVSEIIGRGVLNINYWEVGRWLSTKGTAIVLAVLACRAVGVVIYQL